jgi:hypothetical protein
MFEFTYHLERKQGNGRCGQYISTFTVEVSHMCFMMSIYMY